MKVQQVNIFNFLSKLFPLFYRDIENFFLHTKPKLSINTIKLILWVIFVYIKNRVIKHKDFCKLLEK